MHSKSVSATRIPDEYAHSNYTERTGLYNIKNSCYINSIVQSLFLTRPLKHQILNRVYLCLFVSVCACVFVYLFVCVQ